MSSCRARSTWPLHRSCAHELITLVAHGARDIVLDFEGVSFVDSSGLGVLVGTYKRLRDEFGGSVRIVGAQPSVRKVFEITGLEQALLG